MVAQLTQIYVKIKGSVYVTAAQTYKQTSLHAEMAGFKDLFDLIIRDKDTDQQKEFLEKVSKLLAFEPHRNLLLNGLAQEYAGFEDWQSYIGCLRPKLAA